jgi:thioredoxin-related protein
MKRLCLIALVVLLGMSFAVVSGAGEKGAASKAAKKSESGLWATDLAAAQELAKKEKKYLLIDFTGSDWCGWCQKLDKEVFSQELFQSQAPKDFILVQLDFPKQTKQSEEVKKRNQALAQKYGVRGFPTIILSDAEGREFAKTGYRPGGPKAYLENLQQYVKNHQEYQRLMQEAGKLKGIDKARKLDAAVTIMVANGCRRDYDKLAGEIIALDPQGKAGLKAKYEIPRKLDAVRADLNKNRDFDQAMKKLDQLAGEARNSPNVLQQIYLLQAGILIKGKGEKAAGIKKLELAQLAAPDTQTGKRLIDLIARMKAPPAKPAVSAQPAAVPEKKK